MNELTYSQTFLDRRLWGYILSRKRYFHNDKKNRLKIRIYIEKTSEQQTSAVMVKLPAIQIVIQYIGTHTLWTKSPKDQEILFFLFKINVYYGWKQFINSAIFTVFWIYGWLCCYWLPRRFLLMKHWVFSKQRFYS